MTSALLLGNVTIGDKIVGFATQFNVAAQHELIYYVQDENGAYSNILKLSFTVEPADGNKRPIKGNRFMKINVNAANTSLSTMKKNGSNSAVIKGKLNIGNENNLEKKDKGNFDKAEAVDIDRMKLKFTRDLSDLSADEKAEAAFNSYMSMQRSCREAIGSLELKEYCFTNLKEQKAYYLDLLENDGKISESGGKYEFFGEKDGTYVNKDDIAKALSKVQGHINNYLAEPDEKNDVTNFPKMVFK